VITVLSTDLRKSGKCFTKTPFEIVNEIINQSNDLLLKQYNVWDK